MSGAQEAAIRGARPGQMHRLFLILLHQLGVENTVVETVSRVK
ncbi:MAG: hypothetical protein VB140_03510 [Burkholderia sp.]|nr:MAG: hypothetical protein E5299_00040 [Burkholderia gladioli]